MNGSLKILSFSHIGNSRENHEDNFILRKGDFLSPFKRKHMEKTRDIFIRKARCRKKSFLAAVSDGMGGHSSGEVASLLTVKYLSDNYKKMIGAAESDSSDLISEFSKLNDSVVAHAKNNPECGNMGATLCGVIFKDKKLMGFNIGDSRAYRMDGGALTQISSDHTEGQRLLKLNLLTPEEVEKFPRRKHLYKYIGFGGELIADVYGIDELTKDTILLLCSDGLTDALSDSEIETILKSEGKLKKRGQALIEEALKRNKGRGDNITVIMIGEEKRCNDARRRNFRVSRRRKDR